MATLKDYHLIDEWFKAKEKKIKVEKHKPKEKEVPVKVITEFQEDK